MPAKPSSSSAVSISGISEERLARIFFDLLKIPSPSFHEKEIYTHIKTTVRKVDRNIALLSNGHSLIVMPNASLKDEKNGKTRKHIVFVGHTDVVPRHFTPYRKKDRIHGAGASDMKGGLSVFLYLIKEKLADISDKYRLSFIFYSGEETAGLSDNGLNQLIKCFPEFFKTVDLAIIGEPTDNTIQLGCMGSLHADVVFKGKAAHSARPWQGENALYKAAAFIHTISKLKPEKKTIEQLNFYNVMNITESSMAQGKNVVPEWWKANVNFRFAPKLNKNQAYKVFRQKLVDCGAEPKNIHIHSFSPAGAIIKSPLLDEFLGKLRLPIAAKQAWTDIAQFSALKIPSFNYGPGIGSQCHKENEYAKFSFIVQYAKKLMKLFV